MFGSGELAQATGRTSGRQVAVPLQWVRSLWFDADVVVYGSANSLFTAEITFGSLDGYMSEQELNLVKFTTARMTQLRA
jgi:hypothetical protein